MVATIKSTDVWNERLDLRVDTIMAGAYSKVSEFDSDYLCNHVYPFIQLVNFNAVFNDEMALKLIEIEVGSKKSKWNVHDYGEAVSVAAPHWSDRKDRYISNFELLVVAGKISDLVIKEKKWLSTEVVAGTPTLMMYLWAELKRAGCELKGYAVDANSEKCFDQLTKEAQKFGTLWKQEAVAPKATSEGK
ncbi:MAG: hypothetical protein ACD_20C00114G0001 [uncultured bacterium]|nr:MAG: hypothetical protein ACD_20C00114G0001 [uncultured bacterium]